MLKQIYEVVRYPVYPVMNTFNLFQWFLQILCFLTKLSFLKSLSILTLPIWLERTHFLVFYILLEVRLLERGRIKRHKSSLIQDLNSWQMKSDNLNTISNIKVGIVTYILTSGNVCFYSRLWDEYWSETIRKSNWQFAYLTCNYV